MTPPTVTVVIPTYDRPDMAERAVRSALAQVPQPVVVLVDDGGPFPVTDGVRALEESGAIVVAREGNRGTAGARNVGARRATTEFLLFLDDDDELLPGALDALEAGLRARPDAVMIAGGGHRRFTGGRLGPVEWPAEIEWDYAALIGGDPFFTAAVLVRREAFEAVGGFEERVKLSEDWDLWIRLSQVGRVALAKAEVVEYNAHGNNQSSSGKVAGMATTTAAHYLKGFTPEAREELGPRMVVYVVDLYAVELSWHVRTNLRLGRFRPAWTDLKHLILLTRVGLTCSEGRRALLRAARGHFEAH